MSIVGNDLKRSLSVGFLKSRTNIKDCTIRCSLKSKIIHQAYFKLVQK